MAAKDSRRNLGPVTMEGVRLLFRNFGGAPGPYNEAGRRNFCVAIDEKTAKEMANDGWNIKLLPPREPEDPPQAILKINVRFTEKGRPLRAVLINSKGKTNLDEETISLLDWVEILDADLMIRGWQYDPNGPGIAAYLNSIWVTMQDDPLEMKYYDVPDLESAQGNFMTEGENT